MKVTMTHIYFKCACGKSLAIGEEGAGGVVTCVDCGQPVTIPDAGYEFACTGCAATFIAAENVAGDTVQCIVCGCSFAVPANAPPLPNGPEHAATGEQADGPASGLPRPNPGDEPKHLSPGAGSVLKGFVGAINWARLPALIRRLAFVVTVIFIVVAGSSWFISKVRQSSAAMDLAIKRSQEQSDLAAANIILAKACRQYPMAFRNASRAKNLLAENQARLSDTTNLTAVLMLTKTDRDSSRAANLLAKAIRKYRRATNSAEAEALVKEIQTRANDTWMLATAQANAQMMGDIAAGIKLLEKALAECPYATNRIDAENMIVAFNQQLKENEYLAQAMEKARRETEPMASVKLLADALAKCPNATNRNAALELQGTYQIQAVGKVQDPLLKAIEAAGAQQNVLGAIQLLQEALKNNPDSPHRAVTEQVLATHQKTLLAETSEQRAVLSNYIEGAKQALVPDGYIFSHPRNVPASAGRSLTMYDSALNDKTVAMKYGIEVWLKKVMDQDEKNSRTNHPAADDVDECIRYVPILVLTARHEAIASGSTVVVEYYVGSLQGKSELQCAETERIPFPVMGKGQALAVSARGIELRHPAKGTVLKKAGDEKKAGSEKKDDGEKMHGVIVSLYGNGGELLLQKCSTVKLLKECSLRSH